MALGYGFGLCKRCGVDEFGRGNMRPDLVEVKHVQTGCVVGQGDLVAGVADLNVAARVIMRILRHADQAVTMEICAKASSKATQEALRRLGESPR